MEKVTQRIKKPFTWWMRQRKRVKIGSMLVLALILYIVFHKGGTSSTTIEEAKRQTLSRTVLASGTVVSSTDLSLSFEASKMIDSVRVKVGDKVKKGDILATEKNGSERASYNSARGALLAAEARYNKVLDGSSNEEIALAQTQLDNTTKVQNGLVENARRKLNSDGLVAQPMSTEFSTSVPTISGTYTGTEGVYRLRADVAIGKRVEYGGLERGYTDISDTLPKALGTKGLNIIFPDKNKIAGGEEWIVTIPNTSSASYIANITAYNEAKDARDAAIANAEAELNLKRATARQPEIDVALADIISARAQVEQAAAVLEKTILRAPADGTVTKADIKVGEVPEAMKEAVVIQDVSNLYLESDINESQIKNVAVGQTANVTFDAFDGEKYQATVSSIDPAATIKDNIVNYKVKALLTNTADIRPGMTANISIVTKEVPGALIIPNRAVTTKEGKQYVEKVIDARRNKTQTTEVVTGLHGDGDLVEIISGLNEGDKVLWKANGTAVKN